MTNPSVNPCLARQLPPGHPCLTAQMLQLKRGTEEFVASRKTATVPDFVDNSCCYEPAEHPQCVISRLGDQLKRHATCAAAAAVASVAATIGSPCTAMHGGGNGVKFGPDGHASHESDAGGLRKFLEAICPTARAEAQAKAAAAAATGACTSPSTTATEATPSEATATPSTGASDSNATPSAADKSDKHHHAEAIGTSTATFTGSQAAFGGSPDTPAEPLPSVTQPRPPQARRHSHKVPNLLASVSDFGDRVLSHVFGASVSSANHSSSSRSRADRRGSTAVVDSGNGANVSSTAAMHDDDSARDSELDEEDDAARSDRHSSSTRKSAQSSTARRSRMSGATDAAATATSSTRVSQPALHAPAPTRTHFLPHATHMFDPFVNAALEAAAATERRREQRRKEVDKRVNEMAAAICILENDEDTERVYIEEVSESSFQVISADAADAFGKLRAQHWWDGRKESLTERMTKHLVEVYFRRLHGYARQNFRFMFGTTTEGVPKFWHHNGQHRPHPHRRYRLRHDSQGGIVAAAQEIMYATRVARAIGAELLVDMALTDDELSSMDFQMLPGQRISHANCPPDKLYMYYAFMAFKSHKAAFAKPESLAIFRAAVRDVFLLPESVAAKGHMCPLHAAQMVGCVSNPSALTQDVSILALEERSNRDAATRAALGRRMALLALMHAMDMIASSAYFPGLALDLYARTLDMEAYLRSDQIEGAGVEFMVDGEDGNREATFALLNDVKSTDVSASVSVARGTTGSPFLAIPNAGGGGLAASSEVVDSGVTAVAGSPEQEVPNHALIARTLSVFRGIDDEVSGDAAGAEVPFSPAVASSSPASDSSTSFTPSQVATSPAKGYVAAAPAASPAKPLSSAATHRPARAASVIAPAPGADALSSSIMLGATSVTGSTGGRSKSSHQPRTPHHPLPEHMRLLIGDVLGKGATGCVYAAMCTDTSRMLALKEMRIRDCTKLCNSANRRSGPNGGGPGPCPSLKRQPEAPTSATPSAVHVPVPVPPAVTPSVAATSTTKSASHVAAYDSSDEEVPNVDTLNLTTGAFDNMYSPSASLPPMPPPAVPTSVAAAAASASASPNAVVKHQPQMGGLRPLSLHQSTDDSLVPHGHPGPTHTEMCVNDDEITYSSTTIDQSITGNGGYGSVDSPPASLPTPAAVPTAVVAPAPSASINSNAPSCQQAPPPATMPQAKATSLLEEDGMLTITQDSETESDDGSGSGDSVDQQRQASTNTANRRGSTLTADCLTTATNASQSVSGGTENGHGSSITEPAAMQRVATTPAVTDNQQQPVPPTSRAFQNAVACAIAITEEEQRVVDEINLLRRLRHENIVAYLGCKWDRMHGVVYIVMELCPHSLRDIRKSLKMMPLRLIAHYARGVLNGLRYLHDQHIVHRDIKAANILVTDQGVVKVSDFGVSVTVADDETDTNGETMTGGEGEGANNTGPLSPNAIKRRTLCGTPCFIAPELFNGASCSEASDIWSFGCLMVELASGSSPWWNYPTCNGLWQIARRLRVGVAPTLPKTAAQAAALQVAASATGLAPQSPTPSAVSPSNGGGIGSTPNVVAAAATGCHPALTDMPPPLTFVEGATEATPAFEDFVSQCLAFDTCRRPSAAALLAHPFLAAAQQ